MQVNSVYIHDTRNGQQQVVKEGQTGWVLQAVIARATFWRIPRNGKSYFTMMSLHINNQFAKKRGVGKNLLLIASCLISSPSISHVPVCLSFPSFVSLCTCRLHLGYKASGLPRLKKRLITKKSDDRDPCDTAGDSQFSKEPPSNRRYGPTPRKQLYNS